MLLLVDVVDSDGLRLPQREGPTLPDWAGIGDPREGYYAGLPGKAYAKILKELWTEISPSGAYWNPTTILSDNRLAVFTSDSTRYVFTAPNASPINVHVRLLYRRAFIGLMDQKQWDVPDILMEDFTVTLQQCP
jgi:hypothetical protein